MRYPEFLKENGTIGFAAPSFGASIEPYRSLFTEALENMEKWGYKTALGPNCYEGSGVGISNTPAECGQELTDMYCSKDCDVLISVGGGELMCETVEHVDFELIKAAPPKWFMGYSDNTNFTFLLNTLCDTASVYGPCASDFGQRPVHPAVVDALRTLCGKCTADSYDMWELIKIRDASNPYQGYNCTEKSSLEAWVTDEGGRLCPAEKLRLEGRFIGGCIDVLGNIAGTCYDKVKEFSKEYKSDGILWFLESCDLNPMDFRRTLWKLKHSGWFDNASGFVFGRPLHYGEEIMGVTHKSAAVDMLKELGLPMIFDADIGHLPPAMPIISGSYARITFDGIMHIDYILK